jgi:hypothetical protein
MATNPISQFSVGSIPHGALLASIFFSISRMVSIADRRPKHNRLAAKGHGSRIAKIHPHLLIGFALRTPIFVCRLPRRTDPPIFQSSGKLAASTWIFA